MDHKRWIRDAEKVHASLRELPDNRLVTTTGCKIYFPMRFTERGLAEVGIETHFSGIFLIVVQDKYYGVSELNAMFRAEPTSTSTVIMDGDEYMECVFEPGATVFASTMVVKTDSLVFKIYDEILSKGNKPWFINYLDAGALFNTAYSHAGANIGKDQEVTELIVSLLARDPNDRTKYIRQTLTSLEDLKKIEPVFVPLRSVTYAATNTVNKLAGSYFGVGTISALNNPSERTERIETLLRA